MNQSTCPQCSQAFDETSRRLVREQCGHIKCRRCLLQEESGCDQCQYGGRFNPGKEDAIPPFLRRRHYESLLQSPLVVPPQSETITPPNASRSLADPDEFQSSTQSNRTPTDSRTESEVLQRLTSVSCWLRESNFGLCDSDLELNRFQYLDRMNDVPYVEKEHTDVILRGRQVSAKHFAVIQNALKDESTVDYFSSIHQPFHATDLSRFAAVPEPVAPVAKPYSREKERAIEPPPKAKRKRNSIDHEHYNHIVKNTQLDPPEYLCTVCGRQFKNRLNIRYHIACADKSAGHACTNCDRIFKSSSHLTYHLRTAHGGEKPYKCRFCEKAFAQSVKLKRHERTHTGERPFKCETCGHTFTTKYNLKEHENIHKAEKPYVCKTCKVGFADRNNLRRHEMTHMNQKQQQQQRQLTKKETAGDMANVKEEVTNLPMHERKFNCERCNWSFRRRDNLNRHIRLRHPDMAEVESGDEPMTEVQVCSESKTYQQVVHDMVNEKVVRINKTLYNNDTPVQSFPNNESIVVSAAVAVAAAAIQQSTAASRPLLGPQYRPASDQKIIFPMTSRAETGVHRPMYGWPGFSPPPFLPCHPTYQPPSLPSPSPPLAQFVPVSFPSSDFQVRAEMSPSVSVSIPQPSPPAQCPPLSQAEQQVEPKSSNLSYIAGSPKALSEVSIKSEACLKIQSLLQCVSGDEVEKLLSNLKDTERNALINILKPEKSMGCQSERIQKSLRKLVTSKSEVGPRKILEKRRIGPKSQSQVSAASYGSKKDFLKRYQASERGVGSTVSSNRSAGSGSGAAEGKTLHGFPSALSSVSEKERRELMEKSTVSNGSDRFPNNDFPEPMLDNTQKQWMIKSFEHIMKDVHTQILRNSGEGDSNPGSNSAAALGAVRPSQSGLRKVVVFDDCDEDQHLVTTA